MKLMSRILFILSMIPASVFAVERLAGPSVGPIEDKSPVKKTNSASIQPFVGVPVSSKPYLLQEGNVEGYIKNLANSQIASTTSRCEDNFSPSVTISVTAIEEPSAWYSVCPLLSFDASGSQAIVDDNGSGYKIVIGKAKVQTLGPCAERGVTAHWTVSCYKNTSTG